MCDVPSIAVFCSESIECFPDTVSKFFFKLLVIIIIIIIIIYRFQTPSASFPTAMSTTKFYTHTKQQAKLEFYNKNNNNIY